MSSTKSILNSDRQRIIRLVCDLEKKPSEVARDLNLKVNTVRKIAREYRTLGKVEAKERGGAQSSLKITPVIGAFIKQLVEDDCTLTLDEIKTKVFDNFNTNVSPSTVKRLLLIKITFSILNSSFLFFKGVWMALSSHLSVYTLCPSDPHLRM